MDFPDTLSNVKTGSVGINHTLGAAAYGGGTVNIQKGANVLSGSPSITINSLSLTAGSVQTTSFVPTTATASIGTVTIGLNNQVKTLGLDGTNTGNTVTGAITNGVGTVALTKSNTSTWTLTGTNTFTGATLVSGGTLLLGNANALQNSTTTISSANGLAFSTGIGTFNFGGLAGASNQALTDIAGKAVILSPGANTASYSGVLSGTGGLIKAGAGNQTLSGQSTFTGNTVVNAGTLTLSGTNNGTGTVRGILTINGGTFVTTTANAIGYSAGVSVHTININSGGLFSTTATGDQGFATTWNLSGGTMQSNGGTSNNAATSLLVTGGSALVNSWGNTTATVAGRLALRDVLSTFIVQDGTQATDLLLSAATTGAFGFKKGGAGTMVMTGTNLSTNTITVSGGTLQVGNGTAGSLTSSPLTFTGSGTFNRQAANAAGAYTQAMGALTFSAGDGTVLSTFGTSTTSIATTFSSLAARTAGATGNFLTAGGTNGTTNIINLTGAALGFQNQGEFFGGTNYLWVNGAGGYARAMLYSVTPDTGTATSGATTSVASATHQEITGALSAQGSATFTTLKDSGNNNIVLAGGAVLVTNGILHTGNTAGGATISGGASLSAASGAELVIRNDGLNDALTISTPIIANGSNALTASGLGTLTLSGANTYTGTTTINGGVLGGVSGGILNLSGSILAGNVVVNGGTLNVTSTGVINNASAVSQILVGASAGNNSILNIAAGAVVKAGNTATNSIIVGNAAGSNGFIEMTGGTLATAGLFNLGNGTGAGAITSYAAFSVSAGIVTSGSWLVVGAQNDRAVLNQSGGSITVSTNRMTIGAGGNNSIGVANLSGSAIFNSAAGIFVGETGTGILNVSGSAAMTTGNVQFAGASGLVGVVNLLGGTINTASVTKGTGTGTYLFNFNGGKLQATAATGATFFASLANTTAYVHSNGGTIDNGGFANTVAQPLLAAAGTGLNSIAVSSGGAGYVDTPIVVLTGGSGVGAQAVADVSGGVVTGFTITNRGSGYASTDVLTATLVGGGWTAPATVGAIAFTTNVSGAMTFQGASTTTLSGANTYTGGTAITQGTVALGVSNVFADSGAVNISNGATLSLTTFSDTVGAVTLTSGSITGSSGVLTGSSFGVQSGSASAILAGSGALTKSTGGTVTLTGVNTYSGGTVINGGTLNINADAALGAVPGAAATNLTFTGNGTLQFGANTQTTGATRNIAINSGVTATIDTNGNATEIIAGAIINGTGTGALTKGGGSGILTLSGVSTYTGATAINTGTLNLTGALGSTAVTLATGTVLTGSGSTATTGLIGGSLTVNGGAAITLTAADSTKSLTANGLTLGNAATYTAADYATLNFTLAPSNNVTGINVGTFGSPTGTLTLNSSGALVSISSPSLGTYTLLNYASQAGSPAQTQSAHDEHAAGARLFSKKRRRPQSLGIAQPLRASSQGLG